MPDRSTAVLADLEARMAVGQGVHQQDRQAAEQLRQEAAALRSGVELELRQVREVVSRVVAGQTAAQAEFQTLRQQNERIVDAAEQRFADMRDDYRQEVANVRQDVSQALAGQAAAHEKKAGELRAEMERSMETRIVTAAAAAAAAQLEEHLAPLRAEVVRKELELAELRQRLAESERSVLDVVMAIGDVCRQAADRVNGPAAARPDTALPAPEVPLPSVSVAEASPKGEEAAPAPVAPVPVSAVELPTVAPPAADPTLAQAIPDFLHDSARKSSWRIPLVSSFLVTTGYLLLMHYLGAPLQ